MSDEVLGVERRDGILVLTMQRPEARNALNDALRRSLLDAFAGIDPTADRAVVLRASGPAFCAGADVSGGAPARGHSTLERMRRSTHRLIEEVLACPIPVVSSVQGACAGFGLALALAADFCVVADDARLIPAFDGLGLAPDGAVAATVVRAVGLVHARRLLLLGERLSGARAAEIGLVHAAVGAEELDEASRELAERLASGPTVAYGLTKGMLLRAPQMDIPTLLREERFSQGLLTLTEDHLEAAAAFREKRRPRFTGR
jgi:2-(1,2-epoxy-1,2-dihydrophenyl)acetyl-CoA isomerase